MWRNYLCFYALMEMILADIGYCNWDQYSLANTFGVVCLATTPLME